MPSIVQRLRRIHALEHATMHLLPRAAFSGRLMGRTDCWGFTLYGRVDTAAVVNAAHAALARLNDGQRQLAVHPNCGTNIAVGGLLALGASWLALNAGRRRASRLAAAALLLPLAVGASAPLGELAQAHLTTDAKLHGLRIARVSRTLRGGLLCHRITVSAG